jgi:hypothetical protein
VHLEQKRIGEPPHIVEPLLGSGAFDARRTRLPGGPDDPADERHEHRGRAGHGRTVAPDELRGPIAERVLARNHRQSGEVAPDVFRELIDGRIAASRLLAERLQDDGVEIAGEAAAQTAGVDVPHPLEAGRVDFGQGDGRLAGDGVVAAEFHDACHRGTRPHRR